MKSELDALQAKYEKLQRHMDLLVEGVAIISDTISPVIESVASAEAKDGGNGSMNPVKMFQISMKVIPLVKDSFPRLGDALETRINPILTAYRPLSEARLAAWRAAESTTQPTDNA